MRIERLKPWNWFKHEGVFVKTGIPIRKSSIAPHSSAHPGDSIFNLHREADRLFDMAYRNFGMPAIEHQFREELRPLMDLSEPFKARTDISGDKDHYEITLDLPSMKEEDIAIELQDRVLTIKGETSSESENEDKKYYRVERRHGTFQRQLTLPDDAATEAITATMTDGVLQLTIPRIDLPEADATRIPIQH